jgi:hypothetical protein
VKAHNELREILICTDLIDQVLGYHLQAEREGLTYPGAEDDPRFIEAVQALRGRAAAPLIAELDTRTAFTLWSKAGSWAGAMELAGLDLLTKDTGLWEAVRNYAIQQASAGLLPLRIRNRLSPKCLDAIDTVCDRARKYTRMPGIDELKRMESFFANSGWSCKAVFRELGLYDPNTRQAMHEADRVKSPAERFKDASHWWRTKQNRQALTHTGR